MPNFPVLVPIYFKVTGGTPAIDRNDPRMGDISFIHEEENLRISDASGSIAATRAPYRDSISR